MSDHDENEPYRTGPGRPPLEHRWAKGCPSPNRYGRPPKKQAEQLLEKLNPFTAMAVSFADKKLTKRTAEGSVDITYAQAALEKLFKDGMAGNTRSLAEFLKIIRAAQHDAAEHHQMMLMAAQKYREHYLPIFEERLRNGRPLPQIYPDPRDVIINPDGTVHIYGPCDHAEKVVQDTIERHRNAALQLLHETPVNPGHLSKEQAEQIIRRARRKLGGFNKMLPPRLRKTLAEYRAEIGAQRGTG